MIKDMMHSCCSADGKPDIDKMRAFMERQDRGHVFDVLGWSLFFIWVGIVWLAGLGLGAGLLGVGILTLGVQLARFINRAGVETFWIVIGVAFVLAGIWELGNIGLPLAPIGLIAVGIALLYWQIFHKLRRRPGE